MWNFSISFEVGIRVLIWFHNEQFSSYTIIILLVSIFIIFLALMDMLSECVAVRHLGLLFLILQTTYL